MILAGKSNPGDPKYIFGMWPKTIPQFLLFLGKAFEGLQNILGRVWKDLEIPKRNVVQVSGGRGESEDASAWSEGVGEPLKRSWRHLVAGKVLEVPILGRSEGTLGGPKKIFEGLEGSRETQKSLKGYKMDPM